jgi:hypothetical protein
MRARGDRSHALAVVARFVPVAVGVHEALDRGVPLLDLAAIAPGFAAGIVGLRRVVPDRLAVGVERRDGRPRRASRLRRVPAACVPPVPSCAPEPAAGTLRASPT